jgi:hypothetical protein
VILSHSIRMNWILGVGAKVGIWFIMISFGAHFGYMVMARISLLIGRIQFILIEWLKITYGI